MALIILLKVSMNQAIIHAIITLMKHKKIVPKHHTGKLVHHRHTSYGALITLVAMAVVPIFMMSREVATAAPEDSVTTEYSTYAVVPAPIPQDPPAINLPSLGTVFASPEPVSVSGSCPNDTLIKVFKNDVMAGTVFCQNGRFSINIDLFHGPNALVARAYNANNISGPDSTVVTVRRDVAAQGVDQNLAIAGLKKFAITADGPYTGVNVGQKLVLRLSLSEGQAPYAVSVSWGDGKTDLVSRTQPGGFEVSHVYGEPGSGSKSSHDITVLATDQSGTKSFIHLETIVNGDKPGVVGTIKAGYNWSSMLKTAWQVVLVTTLIVISFWLGERREAFVLKRRA